MLDGATVALVSDAGMPLVSDPGYVLVAGCIAAGLEVEVLPGPSAAIAALVASGLPADRWRFAGFLPRKRGALEALLAAPETVVAFESPRRVGASLAVLAALDPARPVAVCRELTKLHEEVVRGDAVGAGGALRERAAARRGRARHRRRAAAHGRRPGRDRRGPAARRGGRARPAGGERRRRADRRSRQRSVPRSDERRTEARTIDPGRAIRRALSRSVRCLVLRPPRSSLLALALVLAVEARGRVDPARPRRRRRAIEFDLGPDPFARGQHRGVDLAAAPGERVRSACGGRVVFAGRVAGEGTVSVRCGAWRVTYAPLERIAVRAGARVGPGRRLGRVARASGHAGGPRRGDAGLHLGVRREGRRFGYVDPLRFLSGPRRAPPPVVAARPPRAAPRAHPRAASRRGRRPGSRRGRCGSGSGC